MKVLSPQTLVALAALGMSLSYAQSVPCSPPTDPLNGTNWAFHAESTSRGPSSALVGTFSVVRTAGYRRSSDAVLNLVGTMTINVADKVFRLASTTGQVSYNCAAGTNTPPTGGTLQFSDGADASFWSFTFNAALSTMTMTNDYFLDPGQFPPNPTPLLQRLRAGVANRIDNPLPCPNPSAILDVPLGWAFLSSSIAGGNISSSGTIFAKASSGFVQGNISTTVGGDLSYRFADTYGTYQVYPGCTGGNISFQVGPVSADYEFVFSKGDYTSLYLLSIQNVTSTTAANAASTEMLKGTMVKN